MARQIGFHFYSFKIWQRYTRNYEALSALRGRQDSLPLLRDGMQGVIDAQRTDDAAKRMACLKRVDMDGRNLTGIIEAGSYGETANIVHARTGRINHRQNTEEATMLPCFFRLVIPRNNERGVLVLQRDNRVPAKQALAKIIQNVLFNFDEELTCDFTPIANKATFERMVQNGEVQELRFIRLSIPQDFADGYDRGRHELKGSVELSYKANRGASLPLKTLLRSWMRGTAGALDQYEIPGLEDFEFDNVKAEIRVGKKLQTVDFGRRLTHPIIDVTDKVTFDRRSGHPTYESLLEVSAELAEDDAFTAYGE
jgi:hypothetical protein